LGDSHDTPSLPGRGGQGHALTLDVLRRRAGQWRGCVLTIGNCDGVHRGHQALLRRVAEAASVRHTRAVALTFAPHPLRFFRPESEPFELTTLGQKRALLRHYGIDETVALRFDRELSQLAPEAFIELVLRQTFAPRVVVVGYDFAFGRGARGTPDLLRERLTADGVVTHVVPAITLGSDAVSSTRIRDALDAGDVARARSLLGHPHALVGDVARGAGRGRALGFPTANVAVENERLTANGVYATVLETADARWSAITNVGVRPTFGDSGLTVESCVLDPAAPSDLDLYGQRVAVHLLARIREERRFASADALIAQIHKDIAVCQELLAADAVDDFAPQRG
jgi:riboflavin kinase / FMN adenylyltransferase